MTLPKPEEITTDEQAAEVIDFIHEGARLLVELAREYGMIVTINTAPRAPLSMGNYDMLCELRASNDLYRAEQ